MYYHHIAYHVYDRQYMLSPYIFLVYPYVGIIQIRLWVKASGLLSARTFEHPVV